MEPLLDNELGSFLVNGFGDRYLHPVNRTTFNQIGYENSFSEFFGNDYLKRDSLYVVIGTDSGLFISNLLKMGLPAGSKFIFVELPEIMIRLPEVVGLEPQDEKISVVTFDQLIPSLAASRFDDYVYLETVNIVRSMAAMEAFLPEYWELAELVSGAVRGEFWSRSMVLSHKNFLLRKMENLGENRISAGHLKGIFVGKTAVLLAGGPSLDVLLPWIKENRDRIVVLAASRISKRLLEVGLDPHVIFTVDPHPVSFDVSRHMLDFAEKTLLIHADYASPPLIGQWRGKSAYLGTLLMGNEALDGEIVPFTGPTVSNAAFSFAVDMGFSQILLAGVDFCFSKEGYTHAKGSSEHDKGPRVGNLLRVETNDGGIADTIEDYLVARNIMEAQCLNARSQGCRIINLSASAARIDGVDYLPPIAVPFEALSVPFETMIINIFPVESAESRIVHYRQTLSNLLRCKEKLILIDRLCREALKANEKLFNAGKGPNFKYKKKLDQIELSLDKELREFSTIVKRYGIAKFLQVSANPRGEEWSARDLAHFGKEYYSAYRGATEEMLKLISDSERRLNARLEEEKATPDFECLFKQWTEDQQPGRALLWKECHADAFEKCSDRIKDKFEETLGVFNRLMRGEMHLSAKFENRLNEAADVKAKAIQLFRKKDKAGLVQLKESLELAAQTGPELESVRWLTEACLARMDGRLEDSLEHYQKIIDREDGALLEDALLAVVALSFERKEIDNAFLALECLMGLSIAYAPKYAELLRAAGMVEKSLEIYAGYLEQCPVDIPTMMRLGDYYRELNCLEGAQMAYRHVLEVDPDNQAAKKVLEDVSVCQ
ncbi:MAG: hypothetical protein A2X84_14395 [Desulfuromonadaceae bacterium GWC2_58_13]|nr:MAG: hypothetical protein A2X84_14395 [Desulfuromonadaceae bacterium GWC2_58_13]